MLGWPWLKLYRVEGESMAPTFMPGHLLLGSGLVKPKVGHVVVIRRQPKSIKRIRDMTEEGIWVEGDNTHVSTDSRRYGHVHAGDIEAVVFMKMFQN